MTDPVPTPAPVPLTTTQVALPTLGATVGSALGQYLSAKLGFTDPLLGSTITTLTTGLVTALFHWAGTKLGGIKL